MLNFKEETELRLIRFERIIVDIKFRLLTPDSRLPTHSIPVHMNIH
jgi:hypothetical protein